MPKRATALFDPEKLLRAFPPSRRYLIGVSGGRDSVALLHGLVGLGYRKLVVCHLNHQLRGRSSDADARFVEKLVKQIVVQAHRLPKAKAGKRSTGPAMKMEIDFASGSADVAAFAKKHKISIELAAREARYSFFAKVAKAKRCRTIFLGHHADDLVETFLINLFRGSGLAGLAAIREVSKRPVDGVDLTIVRPLLQVWRDDIDKYIRAHRLKFREDVSNKDLMPMRNRVRLKIVPYLEKTFGRNIRQNIWRTATIVSEEENFFEALLPASLSKFNAIAIEPLRKMPVAVQRRMLQKWLRARDVPDVGFDLVERVRELLNVANGVAKINLPRDRHVRRRAKKIFIEN